MDDPTKRKLRRTSFSAIQEMDRLGLNPIEMLAEVYNLAIEDYRKGRGMTDKGDNGASWLAVAQTAAHNLAKFKHPTLSAIALKDLDDPMKGVKPITSRQAKEIISKDPFQIPTEMIVDQVTAPREMNILPKGQSDGNETS